VFKSENGVMLKEIGNSEGIIGDEFIEKYSIIDTIIGEIMKCNMIDDYVKKMKKLPFYYFDILDIGKKEPESLLRIFIYFELEEEFKENVFLKGKYEVVLEGNGVTKVLEETTEIKNMNRFIDELKKFTLSKNVIDMIVNIKMKTSEEEIIEDVKRNIKRVPTKVPCITRTFKNEKML